MIKLPITTIIVIWQIIKSFWFVWVVVLGIVVIQFLLNILSSKIEEIRLKRWLEKHKKLEDWKKLDGREFEKVVATIYKNLGFKTKITGGPGDRGVDIIAWKDKKRIFIQCKQKEVVSPEDIRAFYGSIVDQIKEEEKGLLITTGVFTEEGFDFIRNIRNTSNIELIDGLKLEKLARETIEE